jgi:hypothetical protein
MMWDPSGRILAQTAAEAVLTSQGPRPDAPPRAKQYKHAAHGEVDHGGILLLSSMDIATFCNELRYVISSSLLLGPLSSTVQDLTC